MNDNVDKEPVYTTREYLLFKIDRSIAVLGIIALGMWALYIKTPESTQIGIAAVGGLIGYIGGRNQK